AIAAAATRGWTSASGRHDDWNRALCAEVHGADPPAVERDLAHHLVRQRVLGSLHEREELRRRRNEVAAQLERHVLVTERLDGHRRYRTVEQALMGQPEGDFDTAQLQ